MRQLPRIRPIDPNKLIRILGKIGFEPIRQRWSHVILKNKMGTRIVVPVHPGRDIKPRLVRKIITEEGLTKEEFFKLLEEDC